MPEGTVGILGGLGPLAGAHFYRRLIERTPAKDDSEHLSVILVSDNTVPSRVDNLLGYGPNPAPRLIQLACLLESAGASMIVILSSTTHAYYQEIQEAINVPAVNLLSEVSDVIIKKGYRRPAFLATAATAVLDLYRPYLIPQAEPVYPDAKTQAEIQELVIAVKGGSDPSQLSNRLSELISRPWAEGADCIVLACTELCLFDPQDLELPVISATDTLADIIIGLASQK